MNANCGTLQANGLPSHGFNITPSGYNLIGTCGKCGGMVIQPIMFLGDPRYNQPHCRECSATVKLKPQSIGSYGPTLEMQ